MVCGAAGFLKLNTLLCTLYLFISMFLMSPPLVDTALVRQNEEKKGTAVFHLKSTPF